MIDEEVHNMVEAAQTGPGANLMADLKAAAKEVLKRNSNQQ